MYSDSFLSGLWVVARASESRISRPFFVFLLFLLAHLLRRRRRLRCLGFALRLLLCFCALIRCAAFGTIDSLPRREIATGEKRQGNGIFRIWKARVRGAEKKVAGAAL